MDGERESMHALLSELFVLSLLSISYILQQEREWMCARAFVISNRKERGGEGEGERFDSI